MRDIIVKRAFELASSGECKSIEQIYRRLHNEGFKFLGRYLEFPAIRDTMVKRLRASAQTSNRAAPVRIEHA